jgi:predicted O-methyltransferase YrrM
LLHPTRIRRRLRWRRRALDRNRLLSLLPKDGVCAEIGTWRGDFAAAILSASSPGQLYLVDSWEYRTEEKYEQACYGGHAQAGQEGMDAMYQRVIDRFRSEIDSGRILVQRARSVDAAASFSDESLDWVYIDADHSYEGVKRDLDAYYRVVKSGGFLAGDDYGREDRWFGLGVTQAVDEFAGRCAELTIIGTQFLLKKP